MANPSLTVGVKGDTANLDASLKSATGIVSAFGASLPTSRLELVVNATQKIVTFMHDLTTAGRDAAVEQEAFGKALEATGANMEDWETKTNDAIAAAGKMAFTDDDARAAIENLTRETGSLDEAIGMLPDVMNLARQGEQDLATASEAVAKAMGPGGVGLSLDSYVAGLDRTLPANEKLQLAFAGSAGAAEEFATRTEGVQARTDIAMENMKESVGQKLGGAFSDAREALKPLLEALNELMITILPLLNPLILAMGEALTIVANALTKIVRFATRVINFFKDMLAELQKVQDKLAAIMPDFEILNGEGLIGRTDSRGFFQERDWMNKGGSAGTGPGQMRAGGSGGSMAAPLNMTININGDPAVIEAKIASAIRNYNRRNGAGAIFAPGRT